MHTLATLWVGWFRSASEAQFGSDKTIEVIYREPKYFRTLAEAQHYYARIENLIAINPITIARLGLDLGA